MAIALVIALPVALTLGHLRKGAFLATNVGNVGRAVPTLGVLTILASIPSIGIGNLAAVLALACSPSPLLTNTYGDRLGRRRGAGCRPRHGDGRCRHPDEGRDTPGCSLDRSRRADRDCAGRGDSVLAALVGSGGLGRYVVDGFALQDNTLILAGAILTALLAVLAELVMALVQRAVTPKDCDCRAVPEIEAQEIPAAAAAPA